jgi:replicative DNA helicase
MSDDALLKNVPPHSAEAERAVLGALLVDTSAIDDVATIITPEDLYKPAHVVIYQTIIDLWREGKPIDVVLLNEEMSRRGILEQVGGTSALAELSDAYAMSANAGYYANIVRDHAARRSLIRATAEVQREAFDQGIPTEQMLDKAEKRIFDVTQKRIKAEAVPVKTVVEETFAKLKQIREGNGVVGLPSGFSDLDELTQGLQPSEMTILAARPSMGKCVAAGTEVLLADGRVLTIDALVKEARPEELVTLGPDLRLQAARPSAFVDDGLKPAFRVTTGLGHVVEATATHPFLTPQGWRPLGELGPGTQVAVPRALPFFGRDRLPPSLVTLAGLALADPRGAWPPAAATEPRLQANFEAALAAQGGLEPARRRLATLGLWAGAPEVPARLFGLERGLVAGFLDGLLAAGGTLVVRREGVAARFATASERLARQVQHLLRRFGVVARVGLSGGRGKRSLWRVEVTEAAALWTLFDEVGGLGRPLQVARARGVLSRASAVEEPDASAARPRPLARSARPGRASKAPGSDRSQLSPAAPGPGDLLWDPIVAVVPLGERQVYDLTVPETHTFVANDVVVHNTSLALNILRNITVYQGRPAAFFSLEMPRMQVTQNVLCSIARINGHRLRGGYLTREEERQFLDAAEVLAPAPLFIDDTPGLTTMELRAKARRLKSQHNIDFICIDYMQLMSGSATAAKESRQIEVSEISRMTKALARELNISIMALAQLSRKVEERKDHKPMMSDLRESGSIEQDADMIMLLYRPEYYESDKEELKNRAYVEVAKNRNGPTGSVELAFFREHNRFEPLTRM